ncbi:Gfo/Idh/MocA family oxidoreductase [Pseudomonas sp. MAFF 302030]|uniref:Gfo/Idh/MocA family oxidoreductase n=1 Tax=Pseudomonas morbosilactucae TaxID=2938197 RepID=A0A9X1YWE8_9PSED|nr:Gfo/Idh/MocA family oxidoreductase [Pseudomonas morbosilactucae]MCK9798377.1 Gfo/Idh/MocA family oxidoreductase [Pseudomonas morbosilactucae]
MINGSKRISQPLRWAMVGGGRDSQIGYIHRSAALRDQSFSLVAGAFDLDPERGRAFGESLGLDPERCYADYRSLFEGEARRPDGIQAVSVATPNGTHFAITRAPWMPACMWSVKSPCVLPWPRPRLCANWPSHAIALLA